MLRLLPVLAAAIAALAFSGSAAAVSPEVPPQILAMPSPVVPNANGAVYVVWRRYPYFRCGPTGGYTYRSYHLRIQSYPIGKPVLAETTWALVPHDPVSDLYAYRLSLAPGARHYVVSVRAIEGCEWWYWYEEQSAWGTVSFDASLPAPPPPPRQV